MSFSIFIFIYTIHLAYLQVYTKFENTGSNGNQEICDSLLLQKTTHQYQALYQISES